ncbi:hypothetical protein [Oscillatoria acuminata]|uniref:hypothetical protein n=1 Tax=Oscillatoria acuminata TaxID=118323 RepID=UPI0002FC6D7A|nr:hypothetical protein [Oscillatoria acuminata]
MKPKVPIVYRVRAHRSAQLRNLFQGASCHFSSHSHSSTQNSGQRLKADPVHGAIAIKPDGRRSGP